MIYIVYSPKDSSESSMREAHELLAKKYGCGDGAIVYSCIEFGKNRDHPHLNCIFDINSRSDSLRRSIRKIMNLPEWQTKQYTNTEWRIMLCVKQVTDLPRLVACYLRKEAEAILLFNCLNLQLMESELAKREESFTAAIETTVSILRPVNEQSVITMALSYFRGTLSVDSESFRDFQRQFVLNNYYCSRISWLRVYNYCLIHSQGSVPSEEDELDQRANPVIPPCTNFWDV